MCLIWAALGSEKDRRAEGISGPCSEESAMGDRSCGWMSGPKDPTAIVSARAWWIAVSRGAFVTGSRREARLRPPVVCHCTPTFVSPLVNRPK